MSNIRLTLLMNHYFPTKLSSFAEFLPKETPLANVASNETTPLKKTTREKLCTIHYSWLIPLIEKLSTQEKSLNLISLPNNMATKLAKITNTTINEDKLDDPTASFILNHLTRSWKEFRHITPRSCLKETPLLPLLSLEKKQLVTLIDFLALFDLAQEIKNIVDKKLLIKLYESLDQKKKDFLKICLKYKNPLPFRSLGLENWDGNKEKLSRLLHHLGLAHLSEALSGHEEDFIWHITHQLDTGRGNKILRLISKDSIENFTPFRIKQVIITLNTLQPSGNS